MKAITTILLCLTLLQTGISTLSAYPVILPVKNCNDRYRLIWHHFIYSPLEKTKSMLKTCTFSGDAVVDAMNVLKAGIAYREADYETALRALAPSEDRIIHFYALRKSSPRDGESEDDIAFLYFYLLSTRANANFMLGNHHTALQYYEQWLASSEAPDVSILRYAAYSAYFLEQFERGIGYLKQAHGLLSEQPLKDEVSYVIATFYARLHDAENAIAWLRSPLSNDHAGYRSMLQRDSDFDGIRTDALFRQFLQQLSCTRQK